MTINNNAEAKMRSLCETCAHVKEVVSGKGSRFLLCELSKSDRRFAKYPPQPVAMCRGYGPSVSNRMTEKNAPPDSGRREQAVVQWSGGKDCALALYEARQRYEIVALLTTVTAGYDRISMHGVRISLLEKQAASLGYALVKVVVSQSCSNDEYEASMRQALARYGKAGVTSVICGDLFLEDVRRYREERLFMGKLKGVFPLWNQPTQELASRFIGLGFETILCCVDTTALDQKFSGRLFDQELLAELPPGVDPCGENGEFHTFVFDGPLFANRIEFRTGERVLRDNRFCYTDLIDAEPLAEQRLIP